MSTISVYALTHRAPVEVEEKFCDDLQAVISLVSSSDVLLVMGDFNARVGCMDNSTSDSLLWNGYREILVLAKSTRVANRCFSFVQ